MNIIFFLLGIIGLIGLNLWLPFIIYGAVKKKKGFIVAGILGLIAWLLLLLYMA